MTFSAMIATLTQGMPGWPPVSSSPIGITVAFSPSSLASANSAWQAHGRVARVRGVPGRIAMKLSRYCGRERLPGGRRLWQRLARRAAYRGTVAVYGYGVGGRPGGTQRKAERTGVQDGMVLADYEPGLIRVWVPCTCQAADFDVDQLAEDHEDPVASFAHELGHHVQYARRRTYFNEAVAERYGRLLLREFGVR